MIYRFIKKKRELSPATVSAQGAYQREAVTPISYGYQADEPVSSDVGTGISHVRQMDSSFDETRFNDSVMDTFFINSGSLDEP